MRFSDSFLDEIRARIPVSHVVGRHVVWDRRKSQAAKGDHWACCPFHNEKTPSFHADDRKGRYYCFGCGASGDHFTFLREKEGLSFPEAVERLAQEAGVPMPERTAEDRGHERKRERLYEVMEMAAAFYQQRLEGADGAAARGYLADRGLAATTIQAFRLGYAPAERRALKSHLAAEGVSADEMAEAGLVVAGEDVAVPFDRFRERIVFPINDARGRVVAFGGRALSPEARAKYLNSPEGPLFHKRRMLYNLDRARAPARAAGTLIAVEGYMDVIALSAAGFAHAVAPLGTALGPEQLALMWRLADEPVLCFDGDEAGLKAAFRTLDEALPLIGAGRSLRFALLPAGKDPDDIVREEGADAIARLIAGARAMVDMVWTRETEGRDLSTPERRAALKGRVRELVALIREEEVRRQYSDELYGRLSEKWRLRGAGRTGGRGPGASGRQRVPFRRGGRGGEALPEHRLRAPATGALKTSALVRAGTGTISRREALLLLAVVNHPGLTERFAEEFAALDLDSPALDRLRREILDIAAQSGPLDRAALLDQLKTRGVIETVGRIERAVADRSDWFVHPDAALSDAETGWLHTLSLHRKSSTLRRELRAAELAFGQEDSEENFARLCDIRLELSAAEGTEAAIEGFGEASSRAGGHDR